MPGGRDVGSEVVELYYAKQRGTDQLQGRARCYADFRELLDKEDVDAVKIMTPDHLHATIAVAALSRGKKVLMHKPLANRLQEARLVVEAGGARRSSPPTSCRRAPAQPVKLAVDRAGSSTARSAPCARSTTGRTVPCGRSTRPSRPTRRPCPRDFDWDLWLGPSLPRPYHPHYTHAVFRGWYEFGGGAVADMGHYSLWPRLPALRPRCPGVVETSPSHVCTSRTTGRRRDPERLLVPRRLHDPLPLRREGQPARAGPVLVRRRDQATGARGARTRTAASSAPEGMLFVGDKGKILAGFRCDDPTIIPEARMRAYRKANNLPEPDPRQRRGGGRMGDPAARMRPGSRPSREALRATAISSSRDRSAMP